MGFATRLYEAVFAKTLIRTDILSAAITAVAPALYWLAGRPVPDNLPLLISLWVAVTASGVLLARLITAPYRIWREDQNTIQRLAADLAKPDRIEREKIAEHLGNIRGRLAGALSAAKIHATEYVHPYGASKATEQYVKARSEAMSLIGQIGHERELRDLCLSMINLCDCIHDDRIHHRDSRDDEKDLHEKSDKLLWLIYRSDTTGR